MFITLDLLDPTLFDELSYCFAMNVKDEVRIATFHAVFIQLLVDQKVACVLVASLHTNSRGQSILGAPRSVPYCIISQQRGTIR